MRNQRGSVLLATMIIAAFVAILCGSYLSRVLGEHRLSQQSFQMNAAADLAEAGIEEGLWALNHKTVTASDGWTISGSDAYRTFHSGAGALQLGSVYKGELRVRIDGSGSTTPAIISEARILHPSAPTVVKQVKVTVTLSGSSLPGLTIRDNIVFNNGGVVDSYDSSKGAYNATTNRSDAVTMYSLQGYIQTNDAKIWGRAAVGGSSTSAVGAPMNGGYLRNSATVGSTTYDTTAITTGVQMTWPSTPTPPDIATTGGTVLHITADAVNTIGDPADTVPRYYYYTDNGGTMSLGNTTTLQVRGPVILVIQRGLNMSGTAKILFDQSSSAKLSMYVSENVNMSGTLTVNDQPESSRLTIYGCGGAGQNIAVGGTIKFTGTFYGPYWNVNLNSAVNWSGSILAQYANLSSGVGVHYDTALGGSGGSPKITSWKMLREASTSGTNYARDSRTPFN